MFSKNKNCTEVSIGDNTFILPGAVYDIKKNRKNFIMDMKKDEKSIGKRFFAFIDSCHCGQPGNLNHTCPYGTELYDDYTECNCCDNCEEQCALDI